MTNNIITIDERSLVISEDVGNGKITYWHFNSIDLVQIKLLNDKEDNPLKNNGVKFNLTHSHQPVE